MADRFNARMRMTSADTAARFLASYQSPFKSKHFADTAAEAEGFRAVVLSKIGRLTPKTARQIMRDVNDDWGCTNIRRIYNALTRLIKDGKVKRTPEGYLLTRAQ